MCNKDLCWLPAPNANAAIRLFCFPYAGGSTSTFISWLDELDDSIELVLIQPPGRGARLTESPFNSMSDMIGALMLHQDLITSKPFVFFGHSLGSRVAYELCCELARSGCKLPEYLIASASKAPHLFIEKEPTYHLPDKQFREKLWHLNGTPREIIESDELMDMLIPMLKADFSIAETHRSEPIKLPVSLLILVGENDESTSHEQINAWKELTQFRFDIVDVPGDHFFVDKQKKDVLVEVNRVMKMVKNLRPSHCGSFNDVF